MRATTSGAVNEGVPTINMSRPIGTIAPKSKSLARPSLVQRTLRGVMSQCTKRRECSSASEEHTS